MKTRLSVLLVAAFGFALVAVHPAGAGPIFSQTPDSTIEATASDLDFDIDGNQYADDFILTSTSTVRSVTWRGLFAGGNSPLLPLSFDLIFYNDDAGSPDISNVLTSTTVAINSATDVIDTGNNFTGRDVYEIRANVTDTTLPSSTPLWFSVLADTTADTNDNFFWTRDNSGATHARRDDVSSGEPFNTVDIGDFYFILNDAPIPEPTAGAVLGLAASVMLFRRQRAGT